MNLNELLKVTIDHGASDLHLATGNKPIFRIDGELKEMEDQPELENGQLMEMIKQTMNEDQLKDYEENLEFDYSYTVDGVSRFRVNAFKQRKGASVAFRVIPFEIPKFSELDLPETIFQNFCNYPNGLVLVTGPTGSGKSTTLAAMIDYINRGSGKHEHILTIEDPIEFTFDSGDCLIQQREVGRDTHSFTNALRSALREDPDVIMVGEMRDLETISLALTAAETGHLVFGTLHTNSAAKTIDRIIDAFPSGEKEMIRAMLAESLRGVISQTLLKKPEGGRKAAQEIMMCTGAIRNLIREHKIPQIYSAIQTGRAIGMQTMEQHIDDLVNQSQVLPPDGYGKEV